MYNTFNESIDAAMQKAERVVQYEISKLQQQLEEKRTKYKKMQKYCNDSNGDIAKFLKMISEYGYTACDYSIYDIRNDRCTFCITKDDGEFKIPVAIARNKKGGKLYLTFETKLNETHVNEWTSAAYNMIRDAMFARPRIHVFLHSDRAVKDIFFSLADGLKDVKLTGSSHYIEYTCYAARESLKTLKAIEELEK